MDLIFVVAAGLLGLLFGSFLNVVIYRLPQMSASGIASHGKSGWFLAFPLSFCPHCQTPIPPLHNIPVISYLFLRGRANCCGMPINSCYPLIELSGAAVAVVAALHFGRGLDFVLAAVFLYTLVVISVIDMRRYYILDILTLPLLWLGLLINVDARFALLPDAVLGAAAGYVGMRILAAIGESAFRRQAMGGGDFKLMAAIGAWLGWEPLPFVLFGACVIGLVYALGSYIVRRATRFSAEKAQQGRVRKYTRMFVKGRFCFGPALSLAGAGMMFFGNEIMSAYWKFVFGG